MSIFKKPELTLAEKLAGVKSTFVKAHDEAVSLQVDIESQLEAEALALAAAEESLKATEALKQDNLKFITNLKKFI